MLRDMLKLRGGGSSRRSLDVNGQFLNGASELSCDSFQPMAQGIKLLEASLE